MCKIRWVNNMVKKEKTFFISNSFDGSSSPDLFLDRTILFYLLASPLSNIRLISSKRVIQVFVRKIIYSQTMNRGIENFHSLDEFLSLEFNENRLRLFSLNLSSNILFLSRSISFLLILLNIHKRPQDVKITNEANFKYTPNLISSFSQILSNLSINTFVSTRCSSSFDLKSSPLFDSIPRLKRPTLYRHISIKVKLCINITFRIA